MPSADAIETVSSFILDAPPGELQDVLTDVKSLLGDGATVVEDLAPAVAKYNKEQLVAVKLPGGSQKVIISEHNDLGDGRFFDVESQSSFSFDHTTQKAANVQSYVLESRNSGLIKSLLKSLGAHVAEHYLSSQAYGVYPSPDDATIALAITGSKYSPSNYWNGRWRSVYTFNPSSNSLAGDIKVDVHYYEDGNVRLFTTKSVNVPVTGGSATEIIKVLAKAEKAYQETLNRAFGQLSENAFKNLRRQLPITRQKIDWEKIGSYRLGQDIGGGRASR